jgi:RNA-directed DNA polymerase
MPNPTLVGMLATSFLAGEPTVEQIIARSSHALGKNWPWLRPLAQRYVKAVAGRTRPRHREVVKFLDQDRGFRHAWSKYFHELSVQRWMTEPQRMQPCGVASTWNVLVIESVGALAEWLALTTGELDWFADLKGLAYKKNFPKLGHYHYRVLAKDSRSIRLIEAPKPRLKELQGQILEHILDRIPTHPAAHGFVKGRSIKTFVAPHSCQRVVLRMDLQDFFPSFAGARIQAFFRTLGFPESVADLLGGISTNAAPRDVWNGAAVDVNPVYFREARVLYSRPHLPQGAPTSPALANLCSYRVDCRLAGLAKSAGAAYTRYADDLAVSGGEAFERRVERFSTHVAAILMEEGFHVNHRKTRIMRQGVRQHLAGLVANQHLNVIRTDFDLLKATLTNCVRRGPESQNRHAHPRYRLHLEGRVGFVEMINPAKGKRLRALYEQIRWDS